MKTTIPKKYRRIYRGNQRVAKDNYQVISLCMQCLSKRINNSRIGTYDKFKLQDLPDKCKDCQVKNYGTGNLYRKEYKAHGGK